MVEPLAEIDTYIAGFPPPVRAVLTRIRRTIAAAAPGAVEAISYGMPTFKLHGRNLVHFAGWEAHVGLYPAPSGIAAVTDELAPYKVAKGSIRFELDQPIPYDLITRIVEARVEEETARLKPTARPLPALGAPATRALTAAGITTLGHAARRTEAEIAALHGVGPKAVRLLAGALADAGLRFKG